MIAFLASLGLFCLADTLLSKTRLEGIYYAIHSIHNAAIVYVTAPEIYHTIVDFNGAQAAEPNMLALQFVFALHVYHILYYYQKFRFDDWLHHALMIGIALPIGGLVSSGTLLGYSLFFTTGLPGGIDYGLLFLTRNNWIARDVEKRINMWLNVWIRSPGCVSQAAFTFITLCARPHIDAIWYAGMIAGILNYWNGQYFMAQVVYNAGLTINLRIQ